MRPNLFANTPDILHEYLQNGGRPAFQIRLVLAATLGATYGIYGPPFEQCVGHAAGGTGSEEYLDSEKYQVRHWDLDAPGNLRDFITRINEIRRENPALAPRPQPPVLSRSTTTRSSPTARPRPTSSNIILVVVNLDPLPHPVGLGPAPDRRARPRHRAGRVVPGPRPDQRRPLPLARRVELRPARPVRLPGPHLPGPAEDQDRTRFRLLLLKITVREGEAPSEPDGGAGSGGASPSRIRLDSSE